MSMKFDPFSIYLANNPIFLGLCSLVVNMGSRFIISDLTPTQEYILKLPVVKAFIMFCMCFLITRDIRTSFVLMCGFFLVLYALLNERSQFNIIPRFIRYNAVPFMQPLNSNLTPEEIKKKKEEIIKKEIASKHYLFQHQPKK